MISAGKLLSLNLTPACELSSRWFIPSSVCNRKPCLKLSSLNWAPQLLCSFPTCLTLAPPPFYKPCTRSASPAEAAANSAHAGERLPACQNQYSSHRGGSERCSFRSCRRRTQRLHLKNTQKENMTENSSKDKLMDRISHKTGFHELFQTMTSV